MTTPLQLHPENTIHAEAGAHVSKVEVSERTLSVVALVAAIAAFVAALFAVYEGSITRGQSTSDKEAITREVDKLVRETRQLQIQVMDHNALLIREGLAQPTDETYGPAGNLEYRKHGRPSLPRTPKRGSPVPDRPHGSP